MPPTEAYISVIFCICSHGSVYFILLFSDKAAVEEVNNNQNTMWQGNQDSGHGNWAEFLSPTNDVFVPDDRAWAGTDNVVVEVDEDEEVVQR